MSFRISSGTAAIAAQRYLDKSQREVEKSLKALASGSRLVNAGDDAAGFAISESLRGQVSGIKQAKFNAQNAKSLIQTAEGGLSEQNNVLVRMRELAVYSASDTIGDKEREFINKEFEQLRAEVDRIALTTRFGNKGLLTGTGEEFEFHVGANSGGENVIKFKLDADTSSSELGVDVLDITDQDAARDSLADLDNALLQVAEARATFGAAQSRFEFVTDHLSSQEEHLSSARSLITDVDVAEEVTKLTKNQILQDIGVTVLSQANADSTRALNLLSM